MRIMDARMYTLSGDNLKNFDEGINAIMDPFFTHSARVRLVSETLGKEVYGTNMGLVSLIQQASNNPEITSHCLRLAESMDRSLRFQEELMESIEAILIDMKSVAEAVLGLFEAMTEHDRQGLPVASDGDVKLEIDG